MVRMPVLLEDAAAGGRSLAPNAASSAAPSRWPRNTSTGCSAAARVDPASERRVVERAREVRAEGFPCRGRLRAVGGRARRSWRPRFRDQRASGSAHVGSAERRLGPPGQSGARGDRSVPGRASSRVKPSAVPRRGIPPAGGLAERGQDGARERMGRSGSRAPSESAVSPGLRPRVRPTSPRPGGRPRSRCRARPEAGRRRGSAAGQNPGRRCRPRRRSPRKAKRSPARSASGAAPRAPAQEARGPEAVGLEDGDHAPRRLRGGVGAARFFSALCA